MINLIAAVGKNTLAIGQDNDLIWDIPTDLARFRELTRAHPVIMGRKTWESLPKRPLPNRVNIVVSHNAEYDAPGAVVVTSMEAALAEAHNAPGADEIYVIGGEQIFNLARKYADRLVLTEVEDDTPGDTHFFDYRDEFCRETFHEEHEENGIKYVFKNLECAHAANAS
jgi:dihydrofolate reductase